MKHIHTHVHWLYHKEDMELLELALRIQNGIGPLEKNLAFSYRIYYMFTIYSISYNTRYLPKLMFMATMLINNPNVFPHVPYYGILLSNNDECITDAQNKMDECQIHYLKWKQQDSKGYILYDSIYMTFWKKQRYRVRKIIIGSQGLGLAKGFYYKGAQVSFGSDRTFLYDFGGDNTMVCLC